jgi:molecular chaperone GrpE
VRYFTTPESPAAKETASADCSNASNAKPEDKLAALQDSYLRTLADMEYLRQRTRREVDSAGQFAIQRFAKDIIGVADVLETALGQSGNQTTANAVGADDSSYKTLQQGLEMTLEELHKVLKAHGVTPIDPLHQRFDPNQHMAMYEVPAEDVEPGTVVSVQKKGYLLNGRVIRAAQVAVSKKE